MFRAGENAPLISANRNVLGKDRLRTAPTKCSFNTIKLTAKKHSGVKRSHDVMSAEFHSSPLERICASVSLAVSSNRFQTQPTTHPQRIRVSNTFDDGNKVDKLAVQLKNIHKSNSAYNTSMYAAFDTNEADSNVHGNEDLVFSKHKTEITIAQRYLSKTKIFPTFTNVSIAT